MKRPFGKHKKYESNVDRYDPREKLREALLVLSERDSNELEGLLQDMVISQSYREVHETLQRPASQLVCKKMYELQPISFTEFVDTHMKSGNPGIANHDEYFSKFPFTPTAKGVVEYFSAALETSSLDMYAEMMLLRTRNILKDLGVSNSPPFLYMDSFAMRYTKAVLIDKQMAEAFRYAMDAYVQKTLDEDIFSTNL